MSAKTLSARAAAQRYHKYYRDPKKTLREDLAWLYEEAEAPRTMRGYENGVHGVKAKRVRIFG